MADLTDCDREPIHIAGTVQPHGVLMVLAEPALIITQVSENIADHFPLRVHDVLGKSLSLVLDDPASVDEVREALRQGCWHETNPLKVTARGKPYDGIVHRHEGAAILELEPNSDPPVGVRHPFRPALMQVQRVSTLAELADVVVQQMRRITGFERVMFYRFHEDGHGSVDAEARDPALDLCFGPHLGPCLGPYLGLQYPASDIPSQARQLYLKNWLRLIFDARATPARIIPTLRVDTGGPLDLSFSVLRSVSPVHLEYMRNMGVRTSMSVSLIVRDRLWGLISCLNHTEPRRVSHEIRAACEFLGCLTSLQIAAFEDRELLALRASRRATEDALTSAMRKSSPEDSGLEVLLTRPQELMSLVGAEGAAMVSGQKVLLCGRTPPPALIRDLAAWVDAKDTLRPFSTTSLADAFARGAQASEVASGLLTFALPGVSPTRLMWFRPEIIQTVSWGGDPRKPVAAEPGEPLRPRHSFALWREEVKLRSRPWTASDLEAADELQRCAVEVDLERRLASEQRAVRARDELIAVVSHDLRSPLSTIAMTSERMEKAARAGDGERSVLNLGAKLIRSSASHMKSLIEDLLDLAILEAKRLKLRLQSVESRVLVEEALNAASPLAEAKRITLASELADSPTVEADPERIFRVLSNLLGNAIRFTPESGVITVRSECRGEELLITVTDTGPGIAADHLPHVFERYWRARATSHIGAGLGLHIAKGLVEAHGGRIWAESSTSGAKLSFTLPLGVDRGHRSMRSLPSATALPIPTRPTELSPH